MLCCRHKKTCCQRKEHCLQYLQLSKILRWEQLEELQPLETLERLAELEISSFLAMHSAMPQGLLLLPVVPASWAQLQLKALIT